MAKKAAATNVDVISINSPVPKKKKKKRGPLWRFFSITLKIVLGIVLAIAVFVSGEIIYLYASYTPFYVVGDSMYPTLNSKAERSTGDEHSGNWGNYGFGEISWYNIDFGFMEEKKDDASLAASIERFDVVVTRFPNDTEASGYKIKRVLGLPGESVYFDGQGELWVKAAGATEFSIISQDHLTLNNKEASMYSDYHRKTLAPRGGGVDNICTLGEYEYFVVGDNRSASSDSRAISKTSRNINITDMDGKAIYIVGMCRYTPEVAAGTASPMVLWTTFRFPWGFQEL